MCGIFGVVKKSGHLVNEYELDRAINSIKHRGPDSDGKWFDQNVGFAHVRLAIQDLSEAGHQPMISTPANRYIIIFNGEIYNHIEIRKSLELKYNFSSNTDTETILYGYIEYGESLFNMLNGIFALSIYDTITKDLILVRDQFGVKPLYWYFNDSLFLYGSEIKSFLKRDKRIENEVDQKALANYLNFLWSPGERTPFRSVKKLLPGHFMRINANDHTNIQIKKYYDIPFDGVYSNKDENTLIDELDIHLTRAIERQLLSDVPVGFFLSGGLDSSLVVAIAKKLLPNIKLQCYTIETNTEDIKSEGFSNDLEYAKIVAKHLGVNLTVVKGKVNILEDFDKLIFHLDEPQADPAPINVLNICRKAREDGYIVLLGGTAGDDLFSGYRRHQALGFEPYISMIPPPVARILYSLSKNLSANNSTIRRAQKILRDADKSSEDRLASYYSWIPRERLEELFTDSFKKELDGYFPTDYLKNSLENIPNENNKLNKLLYWDMKYFLTDHNLNYTDKASMAVGVEVRVPYLDKLLLEFSTTLPIELKMKGTTVKYILKKVAERYLPTEVIYRPKAGFGAPVRKWIINDLDPMIEERLSKENIAKFGFFKPEAVAKLIADNKSGKVDASYTIWCLLAIQSWMNQFYVQNQNMH